MTPIFIDFETQSASDLPAVGGRNYAAHESTRILVLVASIDGVYHAWSPWVELRPEQVVPAKFPDLTIRLHHGTSVPVPIGDAVLGGRPVAAHNAHGFDRHVWEAKLKPVPAVWIDTMPLARASGLPGGLDKLGEEVTGHGKDAGKSIMSRIQTADWKHERWVYNTKPGLVEKVMAYCIADVAIMERAYAEFRPLTEMETRVLQTHQAINDRGFGFDFTLAEDVQRLCTEDTNAAGERIAELTEGLVTPAVLRSVPQFKRWLESKGIRLPDLQKETIERFLEDPDDFYPEDAEVNIERVAFEVLELRQAFLKITGAKMERAVGYVGEDRLRDAFVYWGAHTGRWSSKGVQLHNLTKGQNIGPVEVMG